MNQSNWPGLIHPRGGSLFPPLSGFRRFAPRLIELNNPFAGSIQVIPVRDCYSFLPRQHPLITFQQQWFGFDVFLLSSKAGAKQAVGAESLPVIGLLFAGELQGFVREGFTLGARSGAPSSAQPSAS